MSFRHAITIVILLAMVEGIAWWWMHPPLAGLNDPVLTWTPGNAGGQRAEDGGQSHPSSLTPRPEIYAQSAPMLRCSDGKVYSTNTEPGIFVFLAYFEWNASDTGSVLEAFRHMPETCMGSIGLQLIEKTKPISYEVGGGNRYNTKETATLVFDHTIFHVPDGAPTALGQVSDPQSTLHAFKAVWVSGTNATRNREGLFGHGVDQLRTIRIQSALHRYRPAHARVIQGAVRGATDTETAWKIFEDTMLKDLTLK